MKPGDPLPPYWLEPMAAPVAPTAGNWQDALQPAAPPPPGYAPDPGIAAFNAKPQGAPPPPPPPPMDLSFKPTDATAPIREVPRYEGEIVDTSQDPGAAARYQKDLADAYVDPHPKPAKPAAPKSTGAGYWGNAKPVPSEYDKASADMRATYDADKGATRAERDAEMARAEAVAVGSAALAQQKIDDQEIQAFEAQNAARHFADYSAETQRQIDEVRAKRLNPNERYADSGSAAMAVIGGVLGGLYQGLNHMEKNPFIEQMNKTFEHDLAVQEKNLSTQKEGIGERRHLLAEMRATYKDEALAKLQAKNLYYEGAKEAIAAEAAGYDSPTIQARADQAINALSREQSKLDINSALRKAAAAQAATAAAEARRQRDFDNRLKLDEHSRKWAEAGIEAEKKLGEKGSNDVARFVGTGTDEKGNPIGYLERNAEQGGKRADAAAAAQKLIDQIDRVKAIRAKQGWTGRVASEAVHGIYDTEAANELAVLESDMTTTSAQAAHLGALSESDRGLMRVKFRDLNSPGAGADERLDEIRRIAQNGIDAEAKRASGARATKVVENGRERVILQGSHTAPTNPLSGPRTPVGR